MGRGTCQSVAAATICHQQSILLLPSYSFLTENAGYAQILHEQMLVALVRKYRQFKRIPIFLQKTTAARLRRPSKQKVTHSVKLG